MKNEWREGEKSEIGESYCKRRKCNREAIAFSSPLDKAIKRQEVTQKQLNINLWFIGCWNMVNICRVKFVESKSKWERKLCLNCVTIENDVGRSTKTYGALKNIATLQTSRQVIIFWHIIHISKRKVSEKLSSYRFSRLLPRFLWLSLFSSLLSTWNFLNCD